jgi:hypothetical protein
MRYVVLVIAAFWMTMAIVVTYVPQPIIGWLYSLFDSPWMKLIGLIPLIMGIIFLYSAPRFRGTLYLRIIGLLALLKGIFLVAAPATFSRSMMAWFQGLPTWGMRLWALLSLALALPVAVLAIVSLFDEDVI